ncbi:serine/threonine-protein kinase [Paraliomyxa miuraensis]|uniref:serine/threonine-protein kinase n=1 Tax=Paraliomyxa miuraensis TaxID=376150 RepID=UPI00225265A7|nr:serine/threonine-protein kinase [Paraliomyxa miuraensis]MCX4242705.1 serine/threonine-protein kinase [Paraliomyxa miuraensis]
MSVGMSDAQEVASSIIRVEGPGTVTEPERPGVGLPLRIGRYRVLRVLGEGGMGIVYAAYDDELARAVAVKLLRGSGSSASTSGRERMRREAQAMAQLSHPNVVQIHDVGEDGGELYLTMELVRGQTLDAWLAELGPARVRAQRWREILEVFVAAGRGLAAAHAAGLVHRDFKPGNVLVGEGTVKVGDFGLARGDGDGELAEVEDAKVEGERVEPKPSSHKLAERMTETGAVVGTPAYLAPEQLIGRGISAASDQFSFCVALYEALFGQRPFAGEDMRTLSASLLTGQRRSPPAGLAVPSWVVAVIDRGLDREPGERWPSMDALLAALLDDPARRRRRRLVLGVSALAVVVTASALGIREARHRSECEALGSALDERWNEEERQRIDDAFVQASEPMGAESWARVQPKIGAWAEAWREARMDACDDARSDPERAQQTAACLEHERWELEALLDVFGEADRTTVMQAVEAVAELPEVERCDDLTWLASDASLRADGLGEASVGIALRRDLARVLALERAGRFDEALALAKGSVESARGLGDPVVEAEALAKLGGIRWRMSDFASAEQDLLAAHFLAGRVEHDRVAYATARDLSWVVGARLARPKEGRVWLEHARMNLVRSGGDPETEPDVFERLGELEDAEGHYAEALAEHEHALALREQQLGSEHPAVAESLLAVGKFQAAMGDERALATLERARDLAVAALGPEHPTVAVVDNEIGVALYGHDRLDESLVVFRRALTIRERVLGPNEPGLARILSSLAVVQQARGELLESLILLEQATELLERELGHEHPDTLRARSNLASAKAELGQVDEAIESLRDTLSIAERVLTLDDPLLTAVLANLAYYLDLRGDHAEALPSLRRVLALDEARLGPVHPEIARRLVNLAKSELAAGEHEAALTSARRAVTLSEVALPANALDVAAAHDGLALVLLGLDRADEAIEQHGRAVAISAAAGEAPRDPRDLAGLRAELVRLRVGATPTPPHDDLSPKTP